ncbi:MAG: hypothetical protein WCO94_15130, partial [Verrucomicrobiota bacterium]
GDGLAGDARLFQGCGAEAVFFQDTVTSGHSEWLFRMLRNTDGKPAHFSARGKTGCVLSRWLGNHGWHNQKPLLYWTRKTIPFQEVLYLFRGCRGVVSGNAMFASGNLRNEQNDKGNNPPVLGISPGENVPAVEPLREFLVRHPGRMSRGGVGVAASILMTSGENGGARKKNDPIFLSRLSDCAKCQRARTGTFYILFWTEKSRFLAAFYKKPTYCRHVSSNQFAASARFGRVRRFRKPGSLWIRNVLRHGAGCVEHQ